MFEQHKLFYGPFDGGDVGRLWCCPIRNLEKDN